jgi:hypothetical protein
MNAGWQQTWSDGIFNHEITDCGNGRSIPLSQSKADFIDVSFLYCQPTNKNKIELVFGFGVNQKGFIEQGVIPDYKVTYTTKYKATYFGIYAGISFEVFRSEKTAVTIGQLINPELALPFGSTDLTIGEYSAYRLFPASARCFVSFYYSIARDLEVCLSPYFQTAVITYSRRDVNKSGAGYRPYAVGVNVGLVFFKF